MIHIYYDLNEQPPKALNEIKDFLDKQHLLYEELDEDCDECDDAIGFIQRYNNNISDRAFRKCTRKRPITVLYNLFGDVQDAWCGRFDFNEILAPNCGTIKIENDD